MVIGDKEKRSSQSARLNQADLIEANVRPRFIWRRHDYLIMDEVKEYTFEELCQIVGAIAAEYGILKVYLFGSRARGDKDLVNNNF